MRFKILSPKRQLVNLVTPLGSLDRAVQTFKWCEFVKQCKCPIFDKREQLFQYVQNDVIGSHPIDFLEFGVADGASLINWLTLNHDPQSRFWGFDSFDGLPEDWTRNRQKGAFARGGRPPEVSDARLSFEVGLFQDTLPQFLKRFSPKHRLVIHNDSDLYSGTLYTLTQLNDNMPSGTIVMFDEFWDAEHEFRALMDYGLSYRRAFRVIAATVRFGQVAVELLGSQKHSNSE